MTQHVSPQSLSLFDLIARSWDLGAPVRALRFNVVGGSVAVTLGDGRLAFLQTKDGEAPESRMRTELDTGRMTIRPREKPLPMPLVTEAPVADCKTGIAALAQQGFAFASPDGTEIWRATARGQTVRVAKVGPEPVTALATLPEKRGIVVAQGALLTVISPEDGRRLVTSGPGHAVQRLAVSPDGTRIACWGPGQVSVLDAETLAQRAGTPAEGEVSDLVWSPDGRWLVGSCRDKALLLVDVPAARADRIVDFPAPVTVSDFSRKAGVLVAAGAFRVVGWRLPDLPFGDHEGTPIETGKPGLTIVETVAAHPHRDLCAVGYANGLVTLCQIGQRAEMMLREGNGDPATALAWSPDGAHLAIGTAGGTAALATFPKHMFK
ncbi:MAG: WD40 repeat domain-containing protein [Salipiger thiooxidans]|uniref:WD40 repeat domain-containing protein n=1 Tax=Salipiger thiooxidans TaxID=282683 RepID=UPI001CFABDB6|nr:hypothetical protein [Salipiger thiooxidans]